jgi:hypothetical protein
VLVLGAENDSFVYRGGLDATASTYRTKAEVFPGMAHAMMLDRGWESVAARIHGWLEDALVGGEPIQRPVAVVPHGTGRRDVWSPEEAQPNPG